LYEVNQKKTGKGHSDGDRAGEVVSGGAGLKKDLVIS